MINKKITSELAVGVILLLALTISGIFWMQGKKEAVFGQDVTNNDQAKQNIKEQTLSMNIPTGWKLYKNDVLGIEFIYPESWGQPRTAPIANITNLQGIANDFEKQNTAYYDNLSISFENNDSMQLTVFNDKYLGQTAPYAPDYAPIDNIEFLKKSRNICDYKIDYLNKTYGNTIREILNNCENGLKTTLTEERQVFDFGENKDQPVYSYRLREFGFHALVNGYFNNVLVVADFGNISQIKNKISSVEEFYTNPERRGGRKIRP